MLEILLSLYLYKKKQQLIIHTHTPTHTHKGFPPIFRQKRQKTKIWGRYLCPKLQFWGTFVEIVVFFKAIKIFLKKLIPTFFRYIHYLHFKTIIRFLTYPVVNLNYFEIWFFCISPFTPPDALGTKYEVSSMFSKEKVFLLQTFP